MIPTYSPAIMYIDLNGLNGPKVNFWYPYELPENIRILIGSKCSSIISSDMSFIPEVLLVFPLPSLNLKMLMKYFEKPKTQGIRYAERSVLVFLFPEEDDVIFYRYMSYIDSYFADAIKKINQLEINTTDKQSVFNEIVNLKDTLIESTEYLRSKSQFLTKSEGVEITPIDQDSTEEPQSKFKVVILGDPSVGKTSTILRFTDSVFLRAYIPTMGLNITQKRFEVNENPVELRLWDIGGQVRFETIRRQFYEGVSAFIILFDLTKPGTFANVPKWHNDIVNYVKNGKSLKAYLIGNKTDLIKERVVSVRDGIRLATALDMEYIETSALTGHNIEYCFKKISSELLQ
jgi:small GTP-binding protein